MKLLPLLLVISVLLMSFPAPTSGAEASPITFHSSYGEVAVSTKTMSAEVNLLYPEVMVHYKGVEEGYALTYTGLLLTNSSTPATYPMPGDYFSYFTEGWSSSPIETGVKAPYGAYVRFYLNMTVDLMGVPEVPVDYSFRSYETYDPSVGVQSPAPPELPQPPQTPEDYPSDIRIENWATISFAFLVVENDYNFTDPSAPFRIEGMNELKINVSIEIHRNIDVQHIVLLQHLSTDSSTDSEQTFSFPENTGPRLLKISELPGADGWMVPVKFGDSDFGRIDISPVDNGKGRAFYSWLQSAEIETPDGWFSEPVETFYSGDETGMIVGFSYDYDKDTILIFHDPSLGIVPEVIEAAADFVVEHAVSMFAGAMSAMVLASVVIIYRVRREGKRDPLDLEDNPYFKKRL